MQSPGMIHEHNWKPFKQFGFTHKFWTLQADTLISTWVILGIIFIVSWYISRCLKNEKSLVRYVVLQYVEAFRDLIQQSLKSCSVTNLAMIGSIFTFILMCNTIQFIPWLEEPTKDLNTTFALGLLSFLFVQATSIKVNGIWHYIKHYFEPFVLMFPLHVVGAISSIISLSFRLFGNIFGGFIISSLYASALSGSVIAQTFGLVSGANFAMLLIFGIAEGLIQAFVFTMLTLTYLSMEITPEDEEEEKKEPLQAQS
jgi:F-type H+-transporting ATPase subunit a